MLSIDDIHRLAAMGNALRPDWPTKSLITFIGGSLRERTYRECAVALAWVAADAETQTPRRVLEAGPWWNATRAQGATVSVIPTRCGEHPQWRALDCPDCAQTHTSDDETREEHLAAMRDAIRVKSAERRALKAGKP